jgi:O-antigen/teichoic acid export membrane protein
VRGRALTLRGTGSSRASTHQPVQAPERTQEAALAASRGAMREDARALRRGVVVNAFGYGFALLHPPLLVLVVRAYGAETFGLYTAANTMLWLALRVGVLGLDKGLGWWVARAEPGGAAGAIRAALFWVTAASALAALAIAGLFTPLLARWSDLHGAEAMLRWMALGLVPLSLTELILSVGLAQRKLGSKVFVRDGLLPTSFVAVALVAHAAGARGPEGLALAFITSHAACLLAAGWALRRSLPVPLLGRPRRLPAALSSYTRSAFVAELCNSLSQRIDVLLVGALTDARTLGVWAAVMQIGNVVRTIRRSFDPIAMTTFAKIGALPERRRLVQSFSHATRLILTTQTPIILFLMTFAAPLLGLFGAGFEVGSPAVVILCGCWFASGLLGLNGFVVSGYGRSDWILVDVMLATLAQATLLVLLVPRLGLVGAALGVGLSHVLQCVLHAWQARRVAGTWAYDRQVWRVLALSVVTIGVLALLRAALDALGRTPASLLAFGAAMLVFAAGLLWQRAQMARSSEPAPSSPQLG